ANSSNHAPSNLVPSNVTTLYQLSSDSQFHGTLASTISKTGGDGAASGEVLRAALLIEPGSFESYYSNFKFLADAAANMSVYTSNAPSQRSHHFRAATYYREADFYLHGNASDPRLTTLWASQLAEFEAAIALLTPPGQRLVLQGSGFRIPVYYYPAAGAGSHHGGRRPTLLAGTGYDGTHEELYHQLGVHVLARGWNFATYEGPGQPTVRREQGLGFIPNWWDVITPVVDYLSSRDDVAADAIALIGVSFGGSLAPIAASREHRLAAVVCIDGLWSIQQAILGQFGPELAGLFESGNATAFNKAILAYHNSSSTPTSFRWLIDQSLWAFDTTSPFDWMTQLGHYSLQGLLGNVTAPVFVASGQHDLLGPGQAEEVWSQIAQDKAYYYQFQVAYGAGEHCQVGAEPLLNGVYLDWLDGVFRGNYVRGNGTVF
ncbi:alpha/beta-hydrolase, partial [Thozetella sp. PMI_491]